jgi:hypothetical protein
MKNFIDKIDISKHIANHVIGEHHTAGHRKTVGFFVMAIGVSIAHVAAHANLFIALLGDLVGYSIHATGFLPFLHYLENTVENKKPEDDNQETKCENC